MAGIAIILDLWRKNPSFCSPHTALHSSGLLSATAAAASAAAAAPFASRFLFGYSILNCSLDVYIAIKQRICYEYF